MTRFLLVRHALTAATNSTLIGRLPGFSLSPRGVEQAAHVAAYVRRFQAEMVLSSPLERAAETAIHIAQACGVKVETDRSFHECDFGRWTGMTFSALALDPDWKLYNARRSFSSAPGGESLQDVQYRAIRRLNQLDREHSGKTVAVVTHADVIRSILTYVAGVPIDLYIRFAIDPASVSIVGFGGDYPVLEGVNLTVPTCEG
jgi:broad specificity phosphatase PhoE